MSTVTQRINQIKQPKGGYLKPSQFNTKNLNNEQELNENENIHPTVIGMTVDYLTRFIISKNVNESFAISYLGATIATERTDDESILSLADDLLSILQVLMTNQLLVLAN